MLSKFCSKSVKAIINFLIIFSIPLLLYKNKMGIFSKYDIYDPEFTVKKFVLRLK